MSGKKLIGLVAILFLLALLVYAFLKAGEFLVFDQPPHKAEVILVLSGDTGYRVEKAVELYQQGYADKIIMSGGQLYYTLTQAQAMQEQAMELGVPQESIILEPLADSTYGNAVYCLQIMQEQGFKSALVVTSDYHSKRTEFIFNKAFKDSKINLTFCCADDPQFNPHKWWVSNKSIMLTLNEYIKFIGYALGKNT